MRFRDFNCPTPPLIHRRFKYRQKTKINKILFAPPSSIFHTKFAVFHPNSDRQCRSPQLGLKILYLTDSEHKFLKRGIENWLPIGFNLALTTTILLSITNGESIKVLYTHP